MGLYMSSEALFKRRFMWPLISSRPKNVEIEDFLAQILHTASRPITPYQARRDIDLVGFSWINDVPGRGTQATASKVAVIKKGDIFWVRVDDSFPGVIDLEVRGKFYQCSAVYWKTHIRPSLYKTGTGTEEICD